MLLLHLRFNGCLWEQEQEEEGWLFLELIGMWEASLLTIIFGERQLGHGHRRTRLKMWWVAVVVLNAIRIYFFTIWKIAI